MRRVGGMGVGWSGFLPCQLQDMHPLSGLRVYVLRSKLGIDNRCIARVVFSFSAGDFLCTASGVIYQISVGSAGRSSLCDMLGLIHRTVDLRRSPLCLG